MNRPRLIPYDFLGYHFGRPHKGLYVWLYILPPQSVGKLSYMGN